MALIRRATRRSVSNLLAIELAAANGSCYQRTVKIDDVPLGEIWKRGARSGVIWVSGGGVPRSYKYSAHATYLTVAWITRGRSKIVRISAERRYAEVCAHGRDKQVDVSVYADKMEYCAWSAVYPDRAQKLSEQSERRRACWLDRIGVKRPRYVLSDGGTVDELPARVLRFEAYDKARGLAVVSELAGSDYVKLPGLYGFRRGGDVQLIVRDDDGYRDAYALPARYGNRDSAFRQSVNGEALLDAAVEFVGLGVAA